MVRWIYESEGRVYTTYAPEGDAGRAIAAQRFFDHGIAMVPASTSVKRDEAEDYAIRYEDRRPAPGA